MKTVILLSAKLQSGKNQLCQYMMEYLESKGHSPISTSFAAPLKAGAWEDFQPLFSFLEEQHDFLLKLGTPPEAIAWMVTKEENMYEDKTALSRVILQMYGTEIFRRRVSPTHWVDLCFQNIVGSSKEFFFITDARYPNEMERAYKWLDDADGPGERKVAALRVERPSVARNDLHDQHSSETGLDDFACWDYVVDNIGTLDDLRQSAATICDEILLGNEGVK